MSMCYLSVYKVSLNNGIVIMVKSNVRVDGWAGGKIAAIFVTSNIYGSCLMMSDALFRTVPSKLVGFKKNKRTILTASLIEKSTAWCSIEQVLCHQP